MTFRREAEAAAITWKRSTSVLPDEARHDGRRLRQGEEYGPPTALCLPAAFAEYNVLPGIREQARHYFDRHGIRWHAGASSPSNHLLSSQIQCVNALTPCLTDPDRVRAIFGEVLDIDEVLQIDDHYLAFEWGGSQDHLGEVAHGQPRTRGAYSTSADAAVRFRSSSGEVVLALIEWKYTEEYRGKELTPPKGSQSVRHDRYRDRWHREGAYWRTDVVPYDDLFVEPFYQLMRLQLLADAIESQGDLGADVCVVLYLAPHANEELAASLNRDSHRIVGSTVYEIWHQVVPDTSRFQVIDTGTLADHAVTSQEFADRYAHLSVSPSRAGGDQQRHGASHEELRAAVTDLMAIGERVLGSGSVLERVAGSNVPDERGADTRRVLLDQLRRSYESLRRARILAGEYEDETGATDPDHVEELLTSLRRYARARRAVLEEIELSSNRDPLAEVAEHLVCRLLDGALAASRVQRGWDLEDAEGRRVQVRYVANAGPGWINEHTVTFDPDVDRYALVVLEDFEPAAVLVFEREGLEEAGRALGKRHGDLDRQLQLTERNFRALLQNPDDYTGVKVLLAPKDLEMPVASLDVSGQDVTVFLDDDDGYLEWMASNPDGFVLNADRTPQASYLKLHRASCPHLAPGTRSGAWTSAYRKACATDYPDLVHWAEDQTGARPSVCPVCAPALLKGAR